MGISSSKLTNSKNASVTSSVSFRNYNHWSKETEKAKTTVEMANKNINTILVSAINTFLDTFDFMVDIRKKYKKNENPFSLNFSEDGVRLVLFTIFTPDQTNEIAKKFSNINLSFSQEHYFGQKIFHIQNIDLLLKNSNSFNKAVGKLKKAQKQYDEFLNAKFKKTLTPQNPIFFRENQDFFAGSGTIITEKSYEQPITNRPFLGAKNITHCINIGLIVRSSHNIKQAVLGHFHPNAYDFSSTSPIQQIDSIFAEATEGEQVEAYIFLGNMGSQRLYEQLKNDITRNLTSQITIIELETGKDPFNIAWFYNENKIYYQINNQDEVKEHVIAASNDLPNQLSPSLNIS